jgi:hypothetical protein
MARLPRDINGKAIQLPPSSRRIAPEASFTVASAVNKTVEEYEEIEIVATGANVLAKYRTATDTANVTTSNFEIIVLAGTKERYIVPENVTSISLLQSGGTATVILIRRK